MVNVKDVAEELARDILSGKSNSAVAQMTTDDIYALLVPVMSEIEETAINIVLDKKVSAKENTVQRPDTDEVWWEATDVEQRR